MTRLTDAELAAAYDEYIEGTPYERLRYLYGVDDSTLRRGWERLGFALRGQPSSVPHEREVEYEDTVGPDTPYGLYILWSLRR